MTEDKIKIFKRVNKQQEKINEALLYLNHYNSFRDEIWVEFLSDGITEEEYINKSKNYYDSFALKLEALALLIKSGKQGE